MNSLLKVRNFVFIQDNDYTCKDFSYTNFININFSVDTPTSFFRSDFRGSRFENVTFQKNCFDRADFISCTFLNCKFIDVNIGACEVKSCYFFNVAFEKCIFDNASIQESTFKQCVFNNQHLLINMKNCYMIDTEISNCSFERSTTEAITFEKCILKNTDLATMHAECHKFISCDLDTVKLGISYVFGYLLSNTNIKDFEVLYRGQAVNLNSQEEALKFLEESRLYEIINIFFIYQKFDNIPKLLENALLYLYQNYTPTTRTEIKNIFEAVIFYVMQDIIPYNCFVKCLAIINDICLPKIQLEDELLFVGYREKLNFIVSSGKYGKNFIESSIGEKAIITIHVNTNDYEQAIHISTSFLEKLYLNCKLIPFWEHIESKKGSWILTFIISATVIVMLPKIVKNYYNLISEIQIKKAFKKQLFQKLEKKRLSTNEINALADVVEKLDIYQQIDINLPKQISNIKAFL